MKKVKFEKGITLIALIITIIVLLILAAVTIGTMKESGIIGYAQDARSEYTIAQEKERIALAYSEYQIKKAFDTNIEEFEIVGEDVISEPVGSYGWKVKYKNTGNVYGINTKGEYDEAVTMIIEASEATGLGLDCFMIFEDKYALKANAEAGSIIMPERYVFYNWSKLTDDEIVMIETTYTPTLKSERVENATNRLCVLDTDGDGKVDINKDCETMQQILWGVSDGMISQQTHNIIANMCVVDSATQKTVYDEMIEEIYPDDINKEFDPNKNFYSDAWCNFLFKFDTRIENHPYSIDGGDVSWLQSFINGNDDYAYFWRIYNGDDECSIQKYYATGRKKAN